MSPFGETRKIMDSGAAELCSVRTCPVCVEDYFQSPSFFFRVCAIFSELKSEDHKVTGSKPVLFRMFFRRLPSFWGRPRETSEGRVVLQCKIAR